MPWATGAWLTVIFIAKVESSAFALAYLGLALVGCVAFDVLRTRSGS